MSGRIGEKLYWSEREVCGAIGLGLKQLRRFRMSGRGPEWRKVSGRVGRPGGRVLYPVAGVLAWIERQPGGGERPEGQ